MSDPTPPDSLPIEDVRAFIARYNPVLVAVSDFRLALHRYWASVERYSRFFGLTLLQFSILLCLITRSEDNHYTVGELAEEFGIKHPAMVQSLNRMEDKELLVRVEDWRSAHVVITEKGLRLVYASMTHSPAGYTPDTRAVLFEKLQTFIEVERVVLMTDISSFDAALDVPERASHQADTPTTDEAT
jgi:DNA-binding MarR family transcriptional regulator